MKKNIVALAVASAIAAPVAMADAPTVYGQVNQALEFVDTKGADGKTIDNQSGQQVNNIASRLGVKGSSDLGNGMKAVYKVEFSLGMNGNGVGDRNQYVGLAGGFGTVLMGRHDTPLKMSQPKDFFNDGTADFSKLTGGMGAFGKSGENRVNNVLAYVSPSFGGVKLVGALVPKETSGDTTEKSSVTDLYSVAVMYGSKKEGLFLSAAMDKASDAYTGQGSSVKINDGATPTHYDSNGNPVYDVADTTTSAAGEGEDVSHIRVSAQYAMGGLIANAMYQDFSGDGLDGSGQEGNTLTGGVAYKVGKFMPKLAVSQVNRDKADNGDKYEDSLNYAVGVNYSLGKKTTAYVDYSMIEHKGDELNKRDKSDAEESVFSIGLLHKF